MGYGELLRRPDFAKAARFRRGGALTLIGKVNDSESCPVHLRSCPVQIRSGPGPVRLRSGLSPVSGPVGFVGVSDVLGLRT